MGYRIVTDFLRFNSPSRDGCLPLGRRLVELINTESRTVLRPSGWTRVERGMVVRVDRARRVSRGDSILEELTVGR